MHHQTCGNGRTRQTASPCLSSEDGRLESRAAKVGTLQPNQLHQDLHVGPTAQQPTPALPELAWGGAPGPSNSCSSAGRLCTAGHGSLQGGAGGQMPVAGRGGRADASGGLGCWPCRHACCWTQGGALLGWARRRPATRYGTRAQLTQPWQPT